MATYKGKDVQGVLEQFRATLEERDLIHPGDSIGTDDATLQCAGSPRQAVCRLYLLLADCERADVSCAHASTTWTRRSRCGRTAKNGARRWEATASTSCTSGSTRSTYVHSIIHVLHLGYRLCGCGHDCVREQYPEQEVMHESGWSMSWHKVRLQPRVQRPYSYN